MKNYEILEHKADFKVRVFGETKEELFLNAVLAMEAGLMPEKRKKKSENRMIEIKSDSLETLLVDFLSEILYLSQVNKEVYNNVNFKKFSDVEVSAELAGEKVERFGEEIKAVTHHNLEIKQTEKGGWEAIVLFDI